MSTDPSARTLSDLSGETPMDAVRADPGDAEARGVVDMHRRIAARLLAEGAPVRAFNELVRASRTVTMSGRLAAALTRMALAAQTFGPAMLVLNQGLDECEGRERLAVLRHLARLTRRAGNLEESREALVHLLAELPADRRARAVLNALLEREGRWEELDASLEKETKEALRKGKLFAASRASLRRARLWDEQLQDSSRAALRYGQAAQYAEQAQRFAHAFPLRLLTLRALQKSQAPKRALEEGVRTLLAAGDRAGQRDRARAMVRELGLSLEPAPASERPTQSHDTSPHVPTTPEPAPVAAAAAPPEPPRRISTQIELMAIADDVARMGKAAAEVAAVLSAAAREGPDPQAAKKLEAHYIQRGAWRDLARFYKDAVARAATKQDRAAWAEKLAELLESELNDAEGAAQAWADVVSATGDTRAVSEQVRLLAQAKDNTGIRHALDEGVKRAQAGPERARALVLRAEEALTRREVAAARRDFEAALQLVPTLPEAAAGLAELAVVQGEFGPVRTLERALAVIPRRSAGRGDLYRRLARLAGPPVADARLARAAWTEVLAELPGDEEATVQQLAALRLAGDDAALEQALRAFLEREPRGARSREAWLELVALCDRLGRGADALATLKNAVRYEPGHRAAWLGYAERLQALGGRDAELAWALEHAATATEDKTQRLELWRRLARLARESLKDEAKAATFSQRADRLQQELAEEAPPKTNTLPGGPLVVPRRRGGNAPSAGPTPANFDAVAKLLQARGRQPDDLGNDQTPQARAPGFDESGDDVQEAGPTRELEVDELDDSQPAGRVDDTRSLEESMDDLEAEEIRSHDIEVPEDDEPDSSDERRASYDDSFDESADELAEAPADESAETPPPAPPRHHVPRHTQELPVALGDPNEAIPPSFGPSPSKAISAERKALFERVRNEPLEPDGYRLLAEHFDTANDPSRSSLMLEIARALEGDPNAAPRTPRLILNATDRVGLKHPSLRGEAGELMALVGVALCRLYPTTGKHAGTDEEFHLEAGKGAKGAADALLAAVRILGLRAPEVFVAEDAGPPFSLVYTAEPRLLVGKLAVKKETDDAELRFFAGRALFTQLPELMALRNLRRDQLLKGLQLIADVARGRAQSAEARVAKEAVAPRAWERVRQLIARVGRKLNYSQLAEGARYSSNRAGLVVCGGIAPAVAALRVKRALPAEMMELVRFAASERYLQLRSRNLPRK